VVWTIPSPCSGSAGGPGSEGRCCPSSLYTFPVRAGPSVASCRGPAHRGLGSGLPCDKVSPSLGSSASGVSPGALKSYA
jgi:hypothetical protein